MTPIALQFALEDDKVAPGLLGFTVVAVIAAATWLLLKSMTKQLKRVDFEEKTQDGTTPDRTGDGDGKPATRRPAKRTTANRRATAPNSPSGGTVRCPRCALPAVVSSGRAPASVFRC
ncbi:hypothetical protein ACU686_31820 [Yinghuangia aomiensis]